MGKFFLVRSWVLLLCCYCSAISAVEELTFLMADGASEPYQIVSSTPNQKPHRGILTDILSIALSGDDTAIVTVVRPYKRIKLELLAQQYPNWVSYGSPAWLDERVLALGEYSDIPVLESPYALTSLAEFGEQPLDSARGKRVIVIHGYSYFPSFHHWVTANHIQLVYAPSHRHALAMLKQYRGDYYMAESLRVRWQARSSGMPLAELNMVDFSSIIPASKVYFLFDKRIPVNTRNRINNSLRELERSGELAGLIARYQ